MCEHTFCSRCIKEWISRQPTCPVDRMQIAVGDLRPVPRILRNLLCRYVQSLEWYCQIYQYKFYGRDCPVGSVPVPHIKGPGF